MKLRSSGKTIVLSIFVAALLLLAGYALVTVLSAQKPTGGEIYFYSEGKKLPLDLSLHQIGIVARDGISREEIVRFAQDFKLKFVREYTNDIYIFDLPKPAERQEIVRLAREVRQRGERLVSYAGFLATPRGAKAPLIVTDEFIAQFKPRVSRAEMEKFHKENGVQIVEPDRFVKNQYLLRVTEASLLDALGMANRYEEAGSRCSRTRTSRAW